MRRVRDHVSTTVRDNPWLLLLAGVVLFFVAGELVGALALLAGIWLYAAERSRRIRDGRAPHRDTDICSACGQQVAGGSAVGG